MRKAFITGITGQDGSYLAELLLKKNYEVHGLVRRLSTSSLEGIEPLLQDSSRPFRLHEGNLTDSGRLTNLFQSIQPDEIYNLAAQSDDVVSQGAPEYTSEINGMGPVRILESICQSEIKTRFFQASSSEIFGSAKETPQTEKTPVQPLSPYGHAKAFADGMVDYFRSFRKIYAVSGILFNHESPRRGNRFVTKKISSGLARILDGKQEKIILGNLESKRDWGYAPDYVQAMWMTLQPKEPENYVIATGESHSIRELLEEAFSYAGLDYRKYVETDPAFLRTVEITEMRGDSAKAREILGWKPTVSFRQLVRLLVDAELKTLGLTPPVSK
jgi:GDPmannose 4,6-dehydratase